MQHYTWYIQWSNDLTVLIPIPNLIFDSRVFVLFVCYLQTLFACVWLANHLPHQSHTHTYFLSLFPTFLPLKNDAKDDELWLTYHMLLNMKTCQKFKGISPSRLNLCLLIDNNKLNRHYLNFIITLFVSFQASMFLEADFFL